MAAPAPKFVLVKTTSPRGYFGRAGMRFTRDWRPLRVADVVDLQAEPAVIDAAILRRLEEETEMLAVKPATERDLADYEALLAASPRDPATEIAELRGRNADLESRLMRLELGQGQGAGPGTDRELAARNAALEAKNTDLEARLARLEAKAAAPASEAAAPGPAAPAGGSDSKKPPKTGG